VQTASHEIGTGVRTIAAQLTAEQLGLDPNAVEVEMGDTNLPPAPVAGGSNTTASVSSAIIKACGEIREKLVHAVVTASDGPLSGRDPSSLTLQGGKLVAPDAVQDLKDVFKRLGSGVIEQYTEFRPDGASLEAVSNLYKGKMEMVSGEKGEMMKYAFGAEFVEVHIHRRTREIRVPRIVGALAGGRIMNTRTARSQLMGGMIWGISSALHEATEFDRRNARVVNRDLQDYLVPVNADIQEVKVILVPEVDKDVNPAGVKGLGELGNVGTAAAIASAVYHATGKRIRKLPIRIDSLIS
jgi:xanthine dehydrogenase YagR molybdenum-binding subunit